MELITPPYWDTHLQECPLRKDRGRIRVVLFHVFDDILRACARRRHIVRERVKILYICSGMNFCCYAHPRMHFFSPRGSSVQSPFRVCPQLLVLCHLRPGGQSKASRVRRRRRCRFFGNT